MTKMINNTGATKTVRVNSQDFKYVNPGETVDIDEAVGKRYGLELPSDEKPEAFESKAGETTVETKVKKNPERERLIAINGVSDEIADMLLDKYKNAESILKAGRKMLERLPAIGRARARKIVEALS